MMAVPWSALERFFPYPSYRLYQQELIRFVYKVFADGSIGIIHAPTGIGKSVSILVGWLAAWQTGNSGRLLVVTRTKSQLEIYARELRRIKECSGLDFTAAVVKGRQSMCLQKWSQNLNYRDFLSVCRRLRREGECKYYNAVYDERGRASRAAVSALKMAAMEGVASADELRQVCSELRLCPYEVMKLHARYADIVCGSYNYALMEGVRGALLRQSLHRLDIVFDEAHSLPEYAAGLLSDELTTTSLSRAQREITTYEVDDWGLVGALQKILSRWSKNVYQNYGLDREALVKRDTLIEELIEETGTKDETELLTLVQGLIDEGDAIRWRRSLQGKRAISYLASCAEFLQAWIVHTEPYYVRYVMALEDARGRRRGLLGLRCIDPSIAASPVINGARATVLMSGTLWSMDYYIDVLGVDRERVRRLNIPPVYPPENRLILVDTAVTTKYEERRPELLKEIARRLTEILEVVPGRVAIYFPSYELMKTIMRDVETSRPILMERHGMKHEEAISFLSSSHTGLIAGVARGKLSEGVDMVENGRGMLKAVIIVGLPYPRKSELQEAISRYYRQKYGARARKYAYELPCLTALAQAAGRLIRSPADRGVILIMDRRAATSFKRKLPPDWRRGMKAYQDLRKIKDEISNFLHNIN
ncbi:hypothetical protein DRO48_03910 [Candidatus Bathyarchaeota archaeon]|nr:MAG: hypothetical protein DRO48_03910 [Candidatus Bathyarchaeota archaeon]